MAKRKRTVTRSHSGSSTTYRPGFTRGTAPPPGRRDMRPPSARNNNTIWWIVGGVAVVITLLGLFYIYGLNGNNSPGASTPPSFVASSYAPPSAAIGGAPCQIPTAPGSPAPPAATPLASPPAAPTTDGTTATIDTDLGSIVFTIDCGSSPVAAQNFINLASAGFYDGVVFHRLVPDFMIQGGDPQGTGQGGPGYTIQDEPIVGDYSRGQVAMARTSAPNSQGSQFFILVKDSPFLASGNYAIFGQVTSGMDVVDQIVQMPTKNDDPGGTGGTAIDPVVMNSVTIQAPGS